MQSGGEKEGRVKRGNDDNEERKLTIGVGWRRGVHGLGLIATVELTQELGLLGVQTLLVMNLIINALSSAYDTIDSIRMKTNGNIKPRIGHI